jgi:hypothetical protein
VETSLLALLPENLILYTNVLPTYWSCDTECLANTVHALFIVSFNRYNFKLGNHQLGDLAHLLKVTFLYGHLLFMAQVSSITSG